MVTSSNLMRTNSADNNLRFEADANNIHKESIDCGITACNCCNTPGCQKMGTTRTFLAVLVVAGILQGAVETYFRISAKQVALQYEYNPVLIDWMLGINGIVQGVAAILIAYWGNRIHRTAWFGGVFMLQAVIALMAIIPTIVYHDSGSFQAFVPVELCLEREIEELVSEKPYVLTTLVLLFVVAVAIGLGNIVFYCLGLSYMDDNLKEHESPAFIGAALGARYWGTQFGSGVAFFVEAMPLGWWLGWTILCPVLFTVGLLVSMFPKRLLKTVVQLAANRILETVSTNSQNVLSQSRYLADIHLFPSLRRLISNKILMFNVTAMMFLQTGIINFTAREEEYLQSRFFLPASEADGINDEWTSRLISFVLAPPLVGLAILVAGLIIAKVNPAPRKLALWNVITSGLVAALFIGLVFVKCSNSSIAGGERGKLNIPHCSNKCVCPLNTPFSPICPSGSIETYYSACHAGCSGERWVNNVKIFTNCTCGSDTGMMISDGEATEGACNNESCQVFWIIFEALEAIIFALLGSGIVGNFLITIRSVLPQDKSLALSFELCAVGLFAYIPGKLIYDVIAHNTCQLWDYDRTRCYLHETPAFGSYMDWTTAGFILISVIFDFLVYYFVEYLPIYGEDEFDDMLGSMRVVPRQRDEQPSNAPGYAETPLLQASTEPQSGPSSSGSPPPQVTYTEVQKPGFRKIFAPTPEATPLPSPAPTGPESPIFVHPVSPTTDRVLSPEAKTLTPEASPKPSPSSSLRRSGVPFGGVPSILRTVSPLSEESTTSSGLEEARPPVPVKLTFRDRLKKQPLLKLETAEAPGTSTNGVSSEGAKSPTHKPLERISANEQHRPLTPETNF